MTFERAIEFLKKGYKVKREGWNGKDQHIELVTSVNCVNARKEAVECNQKAIAVVNTSGTQVGWVATQADILAEDWDICLYEKKSVPLHHHTSNVE